MKPVRREELLDYVTWSEERPKRLPAILETKRRRRVHVGEVLTLLFENRDTVRYQVQEMVRVERLVKEAEIRHELETYNELLGGPGELGATLLVEIDDPEKRSRMLSEWLALPQSVYVELDGGRRVRARFDERQKDADRLSAVQFLKFETGGAVPVAVGAEMPGLAARTALTDEQRAALAEDLADG